MSDKHFLNIIKNDAPTDSFIHKFSVEDFNKGSTLVVEPGEKAIFVNEGNIEKIFDSGSYELTTQNYPFITKLRSVVSGGVSGFHCVVWFVRTATSREIKWGTETPIKVYDKAYIDQFTGLGVETEVRARGTYRVKVEDPSLLLTHLIGNNYVLENQEDIKEFFKEQFLETIVASLTQDLTSWEKPLISAPANNKVFSEAIEDALSPVLAEYGFSLLKFSLSNLEIVENEERAQQKALVSENRERFYAKMAEGAAESAFAKGKQEAYETYGTNYQQAETLEALKEGAANPGGATGSLMGAGLGLTMGAGLGGVASEAIGGALHASQTQPEEKKPAGAADSQFSANSAMGLSQNPQDRLRSLKQMFDEKLITQEEFDEKKKAILESI